MLNLWTELFQIYPFSLVYDCLKEYILTNTSGFAPSPGQINQIIAKRLRQIDPIANLNADAEWENIQTQLKRQGVRNSKEIYLSLPEPVQKAIGDFRKLNRWGMADSKTLSYAENEFKGRFREILKEHDKEYMNPKKMAEKLNMSEIKALT